MVGVEPNSLRPVPALLGSPTFRVDRGGWTRVWRDGIRVDDSDGFQSSSRGLGLGKEGTREPGPTEDESPCVRMCVCVRKCVSGYLCKGVCVTSVRVCVCACVSVYGLIYV